MTNLKPNEEEKSQMTKQPAYVPPDPEEMNERRSEWAQAAIDAFRKATGCDAEDVLGDLITDLKHWADRHNYDFQAALIRAEGHYEAETLGCDDLAESY